MRGERGKGCWSAYVGREVCGVECKGEGRGREGYGVVGKGGVW